MSLRAEIYNKKLFLVKKLNQKVSARYHSNLITNSALLLSNVQKP